MGTPRIAIAGFQHETNTFAPFATAYEDFLKADLLRRAGRHGNRGAAAPLIHPPRT